jgi:hypothetical protein
MSPFDRRCAALLWVALAVAPSLGGCSTTKGAAAPVPRAEGIAQLPRPEEKVTTVDLTRDQKPDLWSYSVTVKDAQGVEREQLVRRELDLNADGRLDLVNFFGPGEVLERSTLDLDFDGKVDVTHFFDPRGVVIRKERDLDSNGAVDEWAFYEKGALVRKERDANGDGKVDTWEYWENGTLNRSGVDQDADGEVDRWTKGEP